MNSTNSINSGTLKCKNLIKKRNKLKSKQLKGKMKYNYLIINNNINYQELEAYEKELEESLP